MLSVIAPSSSALNALTARIDPVDRNLIQMWNIIGVAMALKISISRAGFINLDKAIMNLQLQSFWH